MAAPLGKDRPTVQQQFLESFARLGTVGEAAAELGINRSTVFYWLRHDPKFYESFNDACESLADKLESSVYQRAFKDPILSMFWLKARRPIFRDRLAVDVEALNREIEQRLETLTVVDPRQLIGEVLNAREEVDGQAASTGDDNVP